MVRMGGTQPMEEQVMLAVEHVQQRHTWDCGLACVTMVLPPSARSRFSSQLYEICQEEGFDKRYRMEGLPGYFLAGGAWKGLIYMLSIFATKICLCDQVS